MEGATCSQLAMRPVSFVCVVAVNPKPPSLMDVNSRILSLDVNGAASHFSCSSMVMWSSVVAVVVSMPIVRAVKLASLAVAVLQRACATCVLSPSSCNLLSRMAVVLRFWISLWSSGAEESRIRV